MQRKFILCTFRNGDFCLLFISIFLKSAYRWTAQNSIINSKNFLQRIFFELLNRVYKTPRFWRYVLYECPSIRPAPSKFWSFIHPPPPSQFAWYRFDDPFPNNVRTFSSIPQHQKKNFKEIVLFCFLPEKRSFVDIAVFWQSRKSWQCVKHNIWGWTYFWVVVGTIFFTMAQAKTKLKAVFSQTFF